MFNFVFKTFFSLKRFELFFRHWFKFDVDIIIVDKKFFVDWIVIIMMRLKKNIFVIKFVIIFVIRFVIIFRLNLILFFFINWRISGLSFGILKNRKISYESHNIFEFYLHRRNDEVFQFDDFEKKRVNVVFVYFITTIVNSIVFRLFIDINNFMNQFIIKKSRYFVWSSASSFEIVLDYDQLEIFFFDNYLMFNDWNMSANEFLFCHRNVLSSKLSTRIINFRMKSSTDLFDELQILIFLFKWMNNITTMTSSQILSMF